MEKFEIPIIRIEDIENSLRKILSEFLPNLKAEVVQEKENLITRKEAAEYLRIDISSLHNWINKEWIKPIKLGRRTFFDKNELDEFIKKSKMK